MSRSEAPSVADAVRVLAAPGSVLALVVLALNDHVLKEAWPGWVTGKLSDVAGLVFAPLLLAVPLAALRVRRPLPVAVVVIAVGFVVTKSTEAGAELVSGLWSVSGVPTMIRADLTDLLALPALAAAGWVDRDARRRPDLPWQRVLTLALGTAVLPCGVLATAATSCDPGEGLTNVTRVSGTFPGPPPGVEERLVIGTSYRIDHSIDASRSVSSPGVALATPDLTSTLQCDPTDPGSCWRIRSEGVVIEHSTDGGDQWQVEVEVSDEQLESMKEDIGEACGDEPVVRASDVGVLPVDGGEPVVVVAIDRGGAYVRDEDGEWQLMSETDLAEAAYRSPSPLPEVVPLDQVEPELPPDEASPDEGSPGEPGSPPTPSCPSPTPTTVTPHPSNGPPTTYDVCP